MNRLANEKSPYLQQHKNNPVDWYAWGEEAFTVAKSMNKPIFLSIGYSTCHWCHVMEKESFEDATIAKMMNETFINIKVDREERPDIDHIYMTVCQMMSGRGGWPLTIFMTPDKKPFFAGTYFPKDIRGNMIGMRQLINRTNEIWNNNYSEILESADEIIKEVLDFQNSEISQIAISEQIFEKLKNSLSSNFDNVYGGFGNRPKFPSPHNLLFLLNYYKFYQVPESLEMAEITLQKMRAGGIYDHIGFGFHRYSTDNEWMVPHFEKMLYDQATLLWAYTDAFKLTHKEIYKQTALEIWEYLKRDMSNIEGGFYSAEDADSEGEEGKFYLWDINEIRENLIGNVDIFCEYFNILGSGNYVDEIHHTKTGKNILHYSNNRFEICRKYKLEESELLEIIENSVKKLFEIRNNRIKPLKDDKILTDWNGMMITSLANAGKTFQNDEMLDFAEKSIKFILNNLYKSKQLFHRYKDGESKINAMLDDYSFFASALIEMFESTFKPEYLENAIEIIDVCINKFYDKEKGGFYFAEENLELIFRKKEFYDGAYYSGNSMMITNLLKLFAITSNPKYMEIAEHTIKNFSGNLNQMPAAYSMFVNNLFAYLKQSKELIIYENENESEDFINQLNLHLLPELTIIKINNSNREKLLKILPHLINYIQINNHTTYYLCTNFVCNSPTTYANIILDKLVQIR